MDTSRHSGPDRRAFTLVEAMVAMLILVMLVVTLSILTNSIAKTWSASVTKIEQFREAREGFETITRRLSGATLNTYWDYERNPSTGTPNRYTRQSELRFISGRGVAGSRQSTPPRPGHSTFFQAPLGYMDDPSRTGLQNLLNTCGYFLEYRDDSDIVPPFVDVPRRTRFRLIEMIESSDQLAVYKYTSGKDSNGTAKASTYSGHEWFQDPLQQATRRVVADNIIALILLPRFSEGERSASGTPFSESALAPDYSYDTTKTNPDAELNPRNQLPPLMQVFMVAIDEVSAKRMDSDSVGRLLDKLDTLFTDASKLKSDLFRDTNLDPGRDSSLEAYLIQNRVNYRIFSTTVSLKAAKWSRD